MSVACTATPPETLAELPTIDTTRVLADITRLSSDEFQGRAPGGEGERLTVEYLATQFKAAGLEPGDVISVGDTYALSARFDNIGGLKVRAPVRSAGVTVGRVTAIDTTAARALPGVLDIITHADVPARTRLFLPEITYFGQPLAAVCATTPAIAEAAWAAVDSGRTARRAETMPSSTPSPVVIAEARINASRTLFSVDT